MGNALTKIESVSGRACVVRGDDIDTDRIIPARFMKVVTFDDMGEHLFKDARLQAKGEHPLDDERFAGAKILVSGQNFGCGSSREHAPQALMRFGFDGFVAGSFAEIFAGNCTAMGLVCLAIAAEDLEDLTDSIELDPTQKLEIDVATQTVSYREGVIQGEIPGGSHTQLLQGTWDATSVLLEAGDAIDETAARLPYVSGY